MIRIRDYRRLVIGQEMDGGEAQECPHCGQIGVAEEVNGVMYYTHWQEWGFGDDGKPVLNWAFCPRTS